MKILFFYALLFILSNVSQGQTNRWDYLGNTVSDEGNLINTFIDTTTIEWEATTSIKICKFWIKWEYKDDSTFDYILNYFEIDCDRKTMTTIREIEHLLGGAIRTKELNKKKKIAPDSMGEGIFKYLCEK